MAARVVHYEAPGWGVAELWLDGRRVLGHTLPRPEGQDRWDTFVAPHRAGPNHPQGAARLPGVSVARQFARDRGGFVANLIRRLEGFFAGDAVDLTDVELDLDGLTGFQRSLLETLRSLPRGEVVTYGELAALAGRPGAARAAGTFCARNRFPVFVPCHRVVGAAGIGGYGSLGLEYKRRLLALEDVAL